MSEPAPNPSPSTIATAQQHDLQFWEDPQAMLAGRIRAPGVYIGALSVLLRQAAA